MKTLNNEELGKQLFDLAAMCYENGGNHCTLKMNIDDYCFICDITFSLYKAKGGDNHFSDNLDN